MQVLNSHFKKSLDDIINFLNNNNAPPEDLYETFINELRVSKLYIPAKIEGNIITFVNVGTDDGLEILQLYTDQSFYSGDNDLIDNTFAFYQDIIGDYNFDGIVINPGTSDFFMETEILNQIPAENESINGDAFDAKELKELSLEVTNQKLVDFISDDSNFNKFDELKDNLKDCVLLNAVSSGEDLSAYAEDGIISTLDAGGVNLSIKSVGRQRYGLLFTSLDSIRQTCDTNINYYYQVASLDKIFEFVLMSDLDGIIINPYLEEYYIPRNVLLDIYFNHHEDIQNPKFENALNYTFLI